MTEYTINRDVGRAGQSLADGQVATTTGAIYTSPGSLYTRVRYISLFNTNAAGQTINLYITRSGGTRRQISQNTGVAQNANVEITNAFSLSPGDALEADTTTSSAVDFFISGDVEEIGN